MTYDLSKQSFIVYFCAVVQNAVRDWLKKNREKCICIQETESQSFINGRGIREQNFPVVDNPQNLFKCLDEVPIHFRVPFKLRYIAFTNLSEEEIEYINRKTRMNIADIRSRVDELREAIINSEKFEEIERANDLVYSLGYRLRIQEERLLYLRRALRSHGISEPEIESLEKKAEPHTLKEIETILAEIDVVPSFS